MFGNGVFVSITNPIIKHIYIKTYTEVVTYLSEEKFSYLGKYFLTLYILIIIMLIIIYLSANLIHGLEKAQILLDFL